MLKNPIPKVTNQLQHRAIGIINGKFTPHGNEQLNRGFLIDNKGEKIETVVLGKALSLLKKHIDLKKNYYWIVYPKNKNTQNLHLQVAGIWDPYKLNDYPNDSSKTNFSKLLEELDLENNLSEIQDLRINNKPTMPFNLGVEKKINPPKKVSVQKISKATKKKPKKTVIKLFDEVVIWTVPNGKVDPTV